MFKPGVIQSLFPSRRQSGDVILSGDLYWEVAGKPSAALADTRAKLVRLHTNCWAGIGPCCHILSLTGLNIAQPASGPGPAHPDSSWGVSRNCFADNREWPSARIGRHEPEDRSWRGRSNCAPRSRRSDRLSGPPVDFPAQRIYFALDYDQSAERASTYYRGALRAPFVGSSVPVREPASRAWWCS